MDVTLALIPAQRVLKDISDKLDAKNVLGAPASSTHEGASMGVSITMIIVWLISILLIVAAYFYVFVTGFSPAIFEFTHNNIWGGIWRLMLNLFSPIIYAFVRVLQGGGIIPYKHM